jgi:serine/threonine-protein kinase RsbW
VADHLEGSSDRRGAGDAWRQWELPATGQAARLARQVTREVLAGWQRADLEETAVLIVSELVTNAVRHASTGGSLVALRLEIAGMSVRIEVHDTDPRWPQPSTPDRLDESGFGFVLVNALASKWGVSDTATGKAVWAELDPRGA